jgi:hypothetical protein
VRRSGAARTVRRVRLVGTLTQGFIPHRFRTSLPQRGNPEAHLQPLGQVRTRSATRRFSLAEESNPGKKLVDPTA